MNPCNIDAIPPLNLHSFLAILQSIVRFEKAKNSPLPPPYLDLDTFATKQWQDLVDTENDVQTIATYYQAMFALKHSTPSLQSAVGAFVEVAYTQWQASDRTVTFFTSGSTGKPKPCVHQESHLRQELLGVLPNIQNCKRALVTVPLHHLYGFTFGLLLPQALGIPIQSEVPFPTVIAATLKEHDLIIAIPLLYDHICDSPDIVGKNISCISGTAPLAKDTFAKMLEKGFVFIEHFGSSELGVMCFRKAPHDPFTLLPHFVEVKPDGSIIRMLPDGSNMHCPIQDTIEWLDDRHLVPKGRKDFAVQIGGVNVFPSHVATIMEAHPSIKHCLVRLMRSEEGSRLKAFIVPSVDVDEKELRMTIRAFMKTSLTDAERPASLTFGIELPRNLIGKPTDW